MKSAASSFAPWPPSQYMEALTSSPRFSGFAARLPTTLSEVSLSLVPTRIHQCLARRGGAAFARNGVSVPGRSLSSRAPTLPSWRRL